MIVEKEVRVRRECKNKESKGGKGREKSKYMEGVDVKGV